MLNVVPPPSVTLFRYSVPPVVLITPPLALVSVPLMIRASLVRLIVEPAPVARKLPVVPFSVPFSY